MSKNTIKGDNVFTLKIAKGLDEIPVTAWNGINLYPRVRQILFFRPMNGFKVGGKYLARKTICSLLLFIKIRSFWVLPP